jgi:hypothetical protein
MKNSSRFLLGFGIFIVVVVAVAVIIALVGGNEQVKLLPEDSPEGTVQQFLMAVKAQDYPKAYGYLHPQSDQLKENSYDNWIRSAQSYRDSSTWKASIVKSTVRENDATVEVKVDVFRPEGPLANPVNTNRITFLLQKENAKWMINSPVDMYWLY